MTPTGSACRFTRKCGLSTIRPMLLMGRKLSAATCLRGALPRLGMERRGPWYIYAGNADGLRSRLPAGASAIQLLEPRETLRTDAARLTSPRSFHLLV